MTVIVTLALATICFITNGIEECHPVLLGKKPPTPMGQYQLIRRITKDLGYGGDVLQFFETKDDVYAIHRIWLLNPEQRRLERLNSKDIKDHYISNGCINVAPDVYDKLVDCCSSGQLIIK
jgi:hypothetical protein